MRLVYIHQYFCTPRGSSGTRSYDVSRHLAEMGHEVTMVCGVLDVGGFEKAPWYKPFRKYRMDGFDVIVCNVPYSNHQGHWGRMWAFLWFAFVATEMSIQFEYVSRMPREKNGKFRAVISQLQ